MTNDRHADYPSFTVLMLCYAMSMALLSDFGMGVAATGVLLVVWGFVVLLRSLWTVEGVGTEDMSGEQRSRLLPWIILNELGRRARFERANIALKVFDKKRLLWLGVMTGYVLVRGYELFLSEPQSNQDEAQNLIENFFTADNLYVSPSYHDIATQIADFIVIGLLFFTIQTYSYTKKQMTLLLWVSLACFAFFQLQLLVNGGALELNFPGGVSEAFLFVGFIIPAFVFFRSHYLNPFYASIGLGVLGVLGADYLFTPGSEVLWFTGWSIVAFLWSGLSIGAVERKS